MKILHVTTHLNIGGITNYIVSLSRALKAMGVDTVVASSGGDMEEELRNSGIASETVNIRTKFEFSPKVFAAGFILSRLIRERGIDLIHAHTRVSQVAAKVASCLAGVPYVTTCHGYFKLRARKVFDTWGSRVIAISDAVSSHLREDLGVDEKRIALVYSGVDCERFSKRLSGEDLALRKARLGLGAGPVIGTIGRLSPVKGQAFLVEAMAEVLSRRQDAQVLIVGDGTEEEGLKGRVRSLGIEGKIHFIRSSPHTEELLQVMDIFVFPSLKEGLGIALLEAMASGRPPIASNVGGIADIIQDGFNGVLVPAGDSKTISKNILKLLEDPDLSALMGDRAARTARERFSLESMAHNIMKVYSEVIKDG